MDLMKGVKHHRASKSFITTWYDLQEDKHRFQVFIRHLIAQPHLHGEYRILDVPADVRAKLHTLLHDLGVKDHKSCDHEGERVLRFVIRPSPEGLGKLLKTHRDGDRLWQL